MKRFVGLLGLVVGLIGAQPAFSAERLSSSPASAVSHDVLAAEAAGLIALKYIPNDSRSAQVVVENKSDQPLTLRLPDAFAGVPVLAQFGMGGMGGMGGGMFSVPPETTKVVKVATVCLEYGKDEPSPRLPYRMVRLDSFSEDPALAAIVVALGRGEIPQKVAQAAAWHLASGRSWQQLAAEKIDRAGGVPDLQYFSMAELLAARQVVAIAIERTGRVAGGNSAGLRQFRSPGEG